MEQKNEHIQAIMGENIVMPNNIEVSHSTRLPMQKLVVEKWDKTIPLSDGNNMIYRCQIEPCNKESAMEAYLKVNIEDGDVCVELIKKSVQELILIRELKKEDTMQVFFQDFDNEKAYASYSSVNKIRVSGHVKITREKNGIFLTALSREATIGLVYLSGVKIHLESGDVLQVQDTLIKVVYPKEEEVVDIDIDWEEPLMGDIDEDW